MKKKITLLMILSVTSAVSFPIAFAETIHCQVKVNTKIVSEKTLTIAANASAGYAQVEDFSLKINNLGASKFEIEVFDPNTPSRNYADGFLRSSGDEVSWALWSRDILLETSCHLASAAAH
jgi:hypothetical protein